MYLYILCIFRFVSAMWLRGCLQIENGAIQIDSPIINLLNTIGILISDRHLGAVESCKHNLTHVTLQ